MFQDLRIVRDLREDETRYQFRYHGEWHHVAAVNSAFYNEAELMVHLNIMLAEFMFAIATGRSDYA